MSRRIEFATFLRSAGGAALVLIVSSVAARAQTISSAGTTTATKADAKSEGQQAAVPIKRVVLFSSGVGFFEHNGDVQGDAQINLKFNVRDINDLLKSMVVQDLGGGKISTVNYGSKDPITKTLKTFAIDLTSHPTVAQLLDQVRGERVEIDSPNKVIGTILGVERRKQRVGKDEVVEVEVLDLLTDDGLRSVPLDNVGRIKLANEKLDAELRQALAILAGSHATDKKSVTLNFLGQGKRPVRIGYVQESPIWKTSYRLVLNDKDPPLLQGWAIVENTTEEDWNDVNLTLISGRPISFIMDLYQPLFVQRPTVVPELYSSLMPKSYDQDLAAKDEAFRRAGEFGLENAATSRRIMLGTAVNNGGRSGGGGFGGGGVMAGGFGGGGLGGQGVVVTDPNDLSFITGQGVSSSAQASNVGELFQYAIATPVALPRQQSAMLPIVNESVKIEKVSIYNPAVQAKHPLNGLKLTNSTALHLMQGPITVFDGGAYAGDAKIEDVSPGGERLISYALDLDVEVATTGDARPDEVVSARLVKGTLEITHKHVRTVNYVVKNSAKNARKVFVEHPHQPEWKLVAPAKPTEETRDMYRFAVDAKPGEPIKLAIEEQMTDKAEGVVNDLDDDSIKLFLSEKSISDKVKQALQEVVKRKQALVELEARRKELEGQIGTIGEEQARIRQNMAQIDRTTDLYKSYITKFTNQETQIEKLRGQIDQLTEQEKRDHKALDDYLIGLDLS